MHSRSGMIFEFGFPFLAHFCPKPNPSYNQSKMGMRLSVEFQSPSRDANSIFGPRPSRLVTQAQFRIFSDIPSNSISLFSCDLTVRTLKLVCIYLRILYESLLLTIGHVTSMTMTHSWTCDVAELCQHHKLGHGSVTSQFQRLTFQFLQPKPPPKIAFQIIQKPFW